MKTEPNRFHGRRGSFLPIRRNGLGGRVARVVDRLGNLDQSGKPANFLGFVYFPLIMVAISFPFLLLPLLGTVIHRGQTQMTRNRNHAIAARIVLALSSCGILAAQSVTISPAGYVAVPAGSKTQFTATVTGLSSGAVTWSVAGSAATYGTISSSGLYSAPATAPCSEPPRSTFHRAPTCRLRERRSTLRRA